MSLSLFRQFRQRKDFACYFASTSARRSLLRQFRQREDFSYYFAVYSPSATIFVLSQAFSLRFCFEIYKQFNFVGERPEFTVLYSLSAPVLLILHCILLFSFNCADSAVQLYRPWAISNPAFSLLFRSLLTLFARFELCVSHFDLQKIFSG
jgi:hypothetical protein